MHNGIDAIKEINWELAHVAEHLPVEGKFRKRVGSRKAVAKKAGVEPDQLQARLVLAQEPAKNWSDITHVSGDKYAHVFP